MHPTTYIRILFYGFVLTMAVAMGVVYVIDPYRIFLSPEIKGINEVKPRAEGEIFFNRMVGIKSNRPKTLLLGNSRVQWGVRAGSDVWPENLRPVYNAAIPGSNNQTALSYLEYAIHTGNITTVVLGLDYFSSLIKESADIRKPVILGNYPSILAADAKLTTRLKSYFLKLASLDSLTDSFLTIIGQKNPYGKDILRNGDNPLNEYKEFVATKGHGKLFKDYLSGTKPLLAGKRRIFIAETRSSPEFAALKRLLLLADRSNVRLYLYFHPYHVTLQELIRSEGRAAEYEKWKRRIGRLVQGYKNLELWDFGGRNAWTTEPVPKAGDTVTHMKWYWEPGHYKNQLGEKILARIFGPNLSGSGAAFGKKIYPN